MESVDITVDKWSTYNFFKNMEKLNSYFSASGIITFNNSSDLQNTFAKIKLKKEEVEQESC